MISFETKMSSCYKQARAKSDDMQIITFNKMKRLRDSSSTKLALWCVKSQEGN